jgi:hypothetical protein
MTVEKQLNGSLLVYTVHKGRLVRMVYYGYTKREAVKLFREHLKSEK